MDSEGNRGSPGRQRQYIENNRHTENKCLEDAATNVLTKSNSSELGAAILNEEKEEVQCAIETIIPDATKPKVSEILKVPVPKRLKSTVPEISQLAVPTRLKTVVPKIMQYTVPTRLKSSVSNASTSAVPKPLHLTEPTRIGTASERVLLLVYLQKLISMVAAQLESNTSHSSEKQVQGSVIKTSKLAEASNLPEVIKSSVPPSEEAKLAGLTTDTESKSNHLLPSKHDTKGPCLKLERPATAADTNLSEEMNPTVPASERPGSHEISSKTAPDTLPTTNHGYMLRKKVKVEPNPTSESPPPHSKKRRKQNYLSPEFIPSSDGIDPSKYKHRNTRLLRFLHLSGNVSLSAGETLPTIPVLKPNELANSAAATSDSQHESNRLQSAESIPEIPISKVLELKAAVTDPSEVKNATVLVSGEFDTPKTANTTSCNDLPSSSSLSMPSKENKKVVAVKFDTLRTTNTTSCNDLLSSSSLSLPSKENKKVVAVKFDTLKTTNTTSCNDRLSSSSLSLPSKENKKVVAVKFDTPETTNTTSCNDLLSSSSVSMLSKENKKVVAVKFSPTAFEVNKEEKVTFSSNSNSSATCEESSSKHKTQNDSNQLLHLSEDSSLHAKVPLPSVPVLRLNKLTKLKRSQWCRPRPLYSRLSRAQKIRRERERFVKLGTKMEAEVLDNERCLTTVDSNAQSESSHSRSMKNLLKTHDSKSPGPITAVTNLSRLMNPVVVLRRCDDRKTSNLTRCDAHSSPNSFSVPSKKIEIVPVLKSNSTLLQAKGEGKSDDSNSSGITKVDFWGSNAPKNGLNCILQQLKNPSLFAKIPSTSVSALKPPESTKHVIPMQTQRSSRCVYKATVPTAEIVQPVYNSEDCSTQENCSDSSNLSDIYLTCDEFITSDIINSETVETSDVIDSETIETSDIMDSENVETSDIMDSETVKTVKKETDRDVTTSFNDKEAAEKYLIIGENYEDVTVEYVELSCILRCRSIRIGSYKVYPPGYSSYLSVYITPGCFFFQAPTTKQPFHLVSLKLETHDIVSVLGHFGFRLPIMFMFTTSECAARVRNQLGMMKRDHAYFDPDSKDQRKKIITFLIDDMNDQLQTYLCYTFPGSILKQVERKEANELLLKSSPSQRKERKTDLDRTASRKKIPECTVSLVHEHGRSVNSLNQPSGNNKIVTTSDAGMSSTTKVSFVCTLCTKVFYDKFEYREHLKTHSDTDCTCHVCDKSFVHEGNLRDHITECHNIENSFVCSICSMEFSAECDLNQHVTLLHGNMSFECKICKNKYSQQKFLMTHMQDHENENLFQCETCKTFRSKSAHERHMTLHQKVKPVIRENSANPFRKAKPYVCEICNDHYTLRSALLLHAQQAHEIKKLYQCSVCKEFYFKENSLIDHLVTMHPRKYSRETLKTKCVVQKFNSNLKISKQNLEEGVRVTENIQSEKFASCDIANKKEENKSVHSSQNSIEDTDIQQSEQSASSSKRKRDKPIYAPGNSIKDADAQKNYQRQKKEQIGHVVRVTVPSHAQLGHCLSKPLGMYKDVYVLESQKSPATALANFQKSTEPSTLVPVRSMVAKSTPLDTEPLHWLAQTCKKLCSKKDDHQNKFLTHSTTNSPCNKTNTVDERSTTFISSFEVEPKEDVGLLFDDDVDPASPPPKLQPEYHQTVQSSVPSPVHSPVQSLSWLVGCWKSITACALYSGVKTVPYREEMQFFSTMQNVLQYNSETWHADTNKMMHCESGFLNVDPTSKTVAFVVTHNFGVSELSEGALRDETMLILRSRSLARMSFTENASLTEIVRCFELKGDILTSEVSIATVSQSLQAHLVVRYEKVF